MAFYLSDVDYFGNGSLGDVQFSDGATEGLNSYANVTAVSSNSITIDKENWRLGDFERFSAGNSILIHISTGNNADRLGEYRVAKISLVENDVLFLDKNISDFLSAADFENYHVQAITFANFDCLKLSDGAIILPPTYDPVHFFGGILAIKCKNYLIFDGGHIQLSDCGITNFNKVLRPLTSQETEANGVLDSAPLAGDENFATKEKFLLNVGDGAAFICAKNISCLESSRIGNLKSHGKPKCRGAADSPFKPDDITNLGGSSILIAAENFHNFEPDLISKYRTKTDSLADDGQGLARAYIAQLQPLKDDKLFAGDFLSVESRISNDFNLFSFGNGENGSVTNPTFQLNNSAVILSSENSTHFIDSASRRGLANFSQDSLILLLNSDKFLFDKVDSAEEDFIQGFKNFAAEKIVAVPQLVDLTISQSYSADIFAVSVKENCDLSSASINADKIFIIADNLFVNSQTKFNAPTFICANSITGLSDSNFSADKNFVFNNSQIATDKKMLCDSFKFVRQGLLKTSKPLDATNATSITGFSISGTQPADSERRFVFTVNDENFIFSGNNLVEFSYPLTLDNVLNFGNSSAELLSVTNIPTWCGELIYPTIALSSPADAPAFPTCKLALITSATTDIYVRDFISGVYPIYGKIKNVAQNITLTGAASATTKVRLKSGDTWGNWLNPADVPFKSADACQFKVRAAVTTLNGSDSVEIHSVTVDFAQGDSLAVNEFAVISNEFDAGDDLYTAYLLIRHNFLEDKNLQAFISFAPSKIENEEFLGVATGELQNFSIDADFDSLVVRADDKNISSFTYNTSTQTLSVTAPAGSQLYALYFDNAIEDWKEMDLQFTTFDSNFDLNSWLSRFVYYVEDEEDSAAVKVKIVADSGVKILSFAAGFSYD